MKIRHTEIEIDEKDPFVNCKLDRKQYAQVLSDIVNTYADGFVLSINNEWGTGKTTFVKMWQQELKNNEVKTIYFNAWENDFDNNPLVALMSELETLTKKNNKTFKSVVEKGAVLTKDVLPALLKSVAKKYIDVDIVADAIENTTKGVTEIFEKEINEYTNKKKTVLEFQKELTKFVNETGSGKPLVFIIDELDRCRPDYAVKVLEQIKHFFSVAGIVFVLSIDKKHLASSIKGYYGSESINTDEYLRRFIDLEYSIPKPPTALFCEYLYTYYSFDDFYSSAKRRQYNVFDNDAEMFRKMALLLFNNSNATLRQQEKMFALTRLVLSSFKPNQYTFSHLLFVLIYMKTMKNQIYEGIKNNTYSIQELNDIFENLISVDFEKEYGVNLFYVNALLLHFYNNSQEQDNKVKLFETNAEGKLSCFIKSKLKTNNFGYDLAQCLQAVTKEYNYNETKLSFLLKKIDLTETINK